MYDEFEQQVKELGGKDYIATFIIEVEMLKRMDKWYKEQAKKQQEQQNKEQKKQGEKQQQEEQITRRRRKRRAGTREQRER